MPVGYLYFVNKQELSLTFMLFSEYYGSASSVMIWEGLLHPLLALIMLLLQERHGNGNINGNVKINRFPTGNIRHSLTKQCWLKFIKFFLQTIFQEIRLIGAAKTLFSRDEISFV